MSNLQYEKTHMKYTDLKLSTDQTHFTYNAQNIFGKIFIQALKFHAEGLAAVCDSLGWYHIDLEGKALYPKRYKRTFGFYCHRSTVVENNNWFHIDTQGDRVYPENYVWCGNFQENICTVRNAENQYFHIDLNGSPIYVEQYQYAGDFKDGMACVRLKNEKYKHINAEGDFLNDKEFFDLGIFHKGIANAKDSKGWFHSDINGKELYTQRYQQIEVFYNGFALVENLENQKLIIDEQGKIILVL